MLRLLHYRSAVSWLIAAVIIALLVNAIIANGVLHPDEQSNVAKSNERETPQAQKQNRRELFKCYKCMSFPTARIGSSVNHTEKPAVSVHRVPRKTRSNLQSDELFQSTHNEDVSRNRDAEEDYEQQQSAEVSDSENPENPENVEGTITNAEISMEGFVTSELHLLNTDYCRDGVFATHLHLINSTWCSGFCFKVKATNHKTGTHDIIRGCSGRQEFEEPGCQTDDYNFTRCVCDGDHCNGSARLALTTCPIVLVLAAVVADILRW